MDGANKPSASSHMSRSDHARTFSALGDRTRLRIVERLAREPSLSITELAADGNVTRQAVTKHLRVLEDAGLVSASKQGREVRYLFEAKQMADAQAFLDDVNAHWDHALQRLRTLLER